MRIDREVNEGNDLQLPVRGATEEDEFDKAVRERGGDEMGWNNHQAVEEQKENVVVIHGKKKCWIELQEENDGFQAFLQQLQLAYTSGRGGRPTHCDLRGTAVAT